MMHAGSIDMTAGSETRHLIRFALPLLAGNLLQQVYNIADTVIVGKVLGDDALAAVGATGSITYFFYTLCLGLATGAGIMISQFFGAGDRRRMRSAVWNSALVTAAFGIFMSILSVWLTVPVLHLLDTPAVLMERSAGYMKIACAGTLAVAAYNWITAVMRALGDSRTPLLFLGVASLLNIGLDLLFVLVFGWGVQGAAAATVLAQCLSAVSCMIFAFRRMPELHMQREDCRTDPEIVRMTLATGLPIAAQSGLISLSMVTLQRVTNGFGETVMASYTASMRVEQFIHQPFASLSTAVSTFTGQNTGAGQSGRVERGLRAALQMSAVLALFFAGLFWLCGGLIIRGFISGAESVALGRYALRVTSLCYLPLGLLYTVRGFLNGAGDTAYAFITGITEIVCRVGGALLLTRVFGLDARAIWYTTGLTWIGTAIVGWVRYRSGKWRCKSLTGRAVPAADSAR